MKEWVTPAEIAEMAGSDLPNSARSISRLAEQEGWRRTGKARKRPGRQGGWEYHVSLLPSAVQLRLGMAAETSSPSPAPTPTAANDVWSEYERLSGKAKAAAAHRLAVIDAVETLVSAGMGETAAIRRVAQRHGVSPATVFGWRASIGGLPRADWLAALAPRHKGREAFAECHPQALDALKSDYLRPERPGFSACYRRMIAAARANGWEPIPSERALRRRIEAEVDQSVLILAREGRDKAKRLFPAQKRTRGHLHAMQAVNIDGHKFDVFVRDAAGEPYRPILVALQDLYSGKIVGWRIDVSENKNAVRLAIGDMVERFGIPDEIWLDNGRAFASKDISGGTANRYRFKFREEEPNGLLTALGVKIHWTTPYSGQSKPIERAFRDLAEEVAKHPICAGAYTGNRPDAKPENYRSTAVPFDVFKALVADRIAEHNARPGRATQNCDGRSFDQTFNDSLALPTTVVRWPSAGQKSLWLLAADRISAQKGSGEIHLYDNRYWARELNGWAGRKVTVRFDPQDLKAGIRVYDPQDRLICEAACIDRSGFDDVSAARATAKQRAAYLKNVSEMLRLHAVMSADELARLHAAAPPPEPQPKTPSIPRIVTRGAAALAKPEPVWDAEATRNFSNAVRALDLRIVGGTEFDP